MRHWFVSTVVEMNPNGESHDDETAPDADPQIFPFGGATMTIGQFNTARKLGPVVGTLVGEVTKGLRCIDGDALTIADGSGSVDIWVPRTVPKNELGLKKWFAFDVVAEADPDEVIDLATHRQAVTDAALAGDPQAAGALALDLIIAIQGSTRPIVANSQRRVEHPSANS